MLFTTVLALALPALTSAQSTTASSNTTVTTTTSSATATATALDYEAICESQSYGYDDDCPQCLHLCENQTAESIAEQCYYSVWTEVNYLESVCEAHGGNNCKGSSVDQVCGTS